MRLLVLGGTGFVGGAVVAEAVRRGWSVTVLNREGGNGWEAVGMTSLDDGQVAVLMKRRADAPATPRRG